MENNILHDFQKFLLCRGFAPPKNVPFYAHWVSKFMAFSNRHDELNHDLLFEKFLDKLKSQQNTADWQIRQARHAVQLYITHFMADKKTAPRPGKAQKGQDHSRPVPGRSGVAHRGSHQALFLQYRTHIYRLGQKIF